MNIPHFLDRAIQGKSIHGDVIHAMCRSSDVLVVNGSSCWRQKGGRCFPPAFRWLPEVIASRPQPHLDDWAAIEIAPNRQSNGLTRLPQAPSPGFGSPGYKCYNVQLQ